MKQYFASDYAYGVARNVSALKVGLGTTTTGAATTYTLYESQTVASTPSQNSFYPLATNAPVLVGTGSVQETLTPSAVTNLPVGQNSTVTFTPTNAHGNGTILASGTVGLQEALNDLSNFGGGGAVTVDGYWAQLGGTTAMIAAAANPGGSSVSILDLRGAAINFWTWNGSAFGTNASGGVNVLYSADGAISIVDQYGVITKAGVCALTLAAPTAAQAGTKIVLTSRTANAHTITATTLLNNGGAGVPYTTATFAAKAGASICLVADNLLWNVLYATNVTLS